MANVCTICMHKNVAEINTALIVSEPLRTIAVRWSVSKTALMTHKKEHLPEHLLKAAENDRYCAYCGRRSSATVAVDGCTWSVCQYCKVRWPVTLSEEIQGMERDHTYRNNRAINLSVGVVDERTIERWARLHFLSKFRPLADPIWRPRVPPIKIEVIRRRAVHR